MIEEFRDIFSNRHSILRDIADQGKTLMGWVCTYVPEEILYAVGIHPVRITGTRGVTATADAHMYSNVCSFARACLEEGFKDNYSFLRGYVSVNTCDNIRRLFEVWSRYINPPFTHILKLPHKVDGDAIDYFAEEVADFKDKLEKFLDKKISDESLHKAIEVYNKTRSSLKEIYRLRIDDHPPISGADVMDVFMAGTIIPRDQYNEKLERLIEVLRSKGGDGKGEFRILLVGSELDSSEYIRTIEELGGLVVCDDLCNGTRYFWDLVETNEPPIKALARRYLTKSPCARMRPNTERIEHIRSLIQDYRIQGIIYEAIKFCDLYGEDFPLFKEAIKDLDTPILLLNREYGVAGLGQMRTRIQAFFERLQG